MGHRMLPTKFFPERPSLPWQQNLGHNGLELGLRKRYIEDLCVRWGIQKCTYAPPQKSYVEYTKNRYYLAAKHLYIFQHCYS